MSRMRLVGAWSLAALGWALSSGGSAWGQKPEVIRGAPLEYSRGFGPAYPQASFSYQAGSAMPAIAPNYSIPPVQPVPYLSGVQSSYVTSYPGYGFGFGGGYGYGSGYGYGYPGYTFGWRPVGVIAPMSSAGYYAPRRVIIQNGYFRR